MKWIWTIAISAVTTVLLSACSASTPVERLQSQLSDFSEYSIILEDMRQEGNFFTDYYHRYKVVRSEPLPDSDSLTYVSETTDWQRVSEKDFRKYEPFLGMALVTKGPEGKVSDSRQPPGYQYVGDPQYGYWRTDNSGGSFWEFYGKYALISSLFNLGGNMIYRNDYNNYRRTINNGMPYYGPNKQYGTYGSRTRQTNPTFFQRRQAREQARRQSFGERVQNRTRRSNMSGTRSRSSSYGK